MSTETLRPGDNLPSMRHRDKNGSDGQTRIGSR